MVIFMLWQNLNSMEYLRSGILDMHLKEVTTQNGENAFYMYATVPSMQPIVDTYRRASGLLSIFYPSLLPQLDNAFASYPDILAGLKANKADVVWKAMEKYAVQALEGRFGTSSDLVILVKSYVDAGRVNHGHTYYLMEGALDRVTENGNAVNKYREGDAFVQLL